MTDELRFSYYFDGDDNLPMPLASADTPVSEMSAGRTERLEALLDGKVVIDGLVEADASISGPVFIGGGTTVHAGAEIQGPVYIGRNCSIRHGAQIRQGTILADECVVGHSAEIKNSVCMSGSKMQSGVFVGDSVLGLGARLGSGTILANRRFQQDEIVLKAGAERLSTELSFFGAVIGDYARLGANVVTAPGTLVGPYTWVGSLVSLYGFVPRAKLVILKQDLVIRDKEEVTLSSGWGEYEKS
jgi:UDP-N-acetylglucosamine diphosphorylase / glucose-1-phosphate thymidylyltransferase / UDP-N-acetylgalactosamine diphosphorylase / glucosamine-1-phosphate N-acetyltransferase / galactosamine-1-phosphate N-acetyltransferase